MEVYILHLDIMCEANAVYMCACVFYVGENKKGREIGGERKVSADCGRRLSISPTCGCPGVCAGLA